MKKHKVKTNTYANFCTLVHVDCGVHLDWT